MSRLSIEEGKMRSQSAIKNLKHTLFASEFRLKTQIEKQTVKIKSQKRKKLSEGSLVMINQTELPTNKKNKKILIQEFELSSLNNNEAGNEK
jgi:hypothetical protein